MVLPICDEASSEDGLAVVGSCWQQGPEAWRLTTPDERVRSAFSLDV